jgi:hypothetical protein
MHLIRPGTDWDQALHAAWDLARQLPADGAGLVGFGVAHLLDGDGRTKQLVPFANTITDAGDTYVAQKAIAGIAPASPSAPTAASGMKLGTSSTAVSKSAGTGIALGTYLTGSNAAFDASYPQSSALGTNLGTTAIYKTTWAAGVATSSTINEAVIVNDAGTNATSTSANTYARTVLTTVNKGASDSLALTWTWKALGA